MSGCGQRAMWGMSMSYAGELRPRVSRESWENEFHSHGESSQHGHTQHIKAVLQLRRRNRSENHLQKNRVLLRGHGAEAEPM